MKQGNNRYKELHSSVEGSYDPLIESLPGDLRRIAEVAGIEAAVKIGQAFRGTYIYIPGLDDLMKRARDERIRKEYDEGKLVKMIAVKYGLSERGTWKILKKPPKPLNPLINMLLEDDGD